jgi:hypothetical protein
MFNPNRSYRLDGVILRLEAQPHPIIGLLLRWYKRWLERGI